MVRIILRIPLEAFILQSTATGGLMQKNNWGYFEKLRIKFWFGLIHIP